MVTGMNLTILETGRPPAPLHEAFPGYPAMLEALVSPFLPDLKVRTVALIDGEALPDPSKTEAVMITGSPAGVYDPLDWIAPLKAFIREAGRLGVPQVGICFGHQIMAEAFGGHAAKAPQGWGIGRHTYQMAAREPWMCAHGQGGEGLALAVSHQDQVLAAPPGARVLARSDFTPNAALVYDHVPALSFQGHPEFAPDFARALIAARRGTRFAEDVADRALESLQHDLHGGIVGGWIAGFLRHACAMNRSAPAPAQRRRAA